MAAKVHGGGSKGGSDAFDPVKLKDCFEDTIKSLQSLMKETEARISSFEKECTEEESVHKKNSQAVESNFKVFFLFYWVFWCVELPANNKPTLGGSFET